MNNFFIRIQQRTWPTETGIWNHVDQTVKLKSTGRKANYLTLFSLGMLVTPSRKVISRCISCYLCISMYLFFFHCIFLTWTLCSQQEHMSDPQGVLCPHKLPCLLLSDRVSETLKANTAPPFSISPSFIAPIGPPSPHPNPLSFNPHLCSSLSTNLWSHLNSTQTFKVCERLFVHTLWSHCPPLNQLGSLSLGSFFNLSSNLRAAQRKGDLRFTSHKSPQIFRSFHQQTVWLSFRATSLRPLTLGIFTLAAQEEILSWRLSHSRSSPINYAVVNPIGSELCQTWTH